jgi:penicillin-binding protein 1C
VSRRSLPSLLRRLLLAAACLLLALVGLAVTLVEATSYFVELPAPLARREQSLRILDRHGRLLREVRSGRETKSRWVALDEISPHVVAATLAAEDRRFWSHGGVDVLAVGRALVQDVLSAEVVSGASTITMQLARILRGGDRTLANKLLEAALARRIERTFDKRRILEEYLNRAPYGNEVEGIEAAAWGYFRKSSRELSLGEAAALAALPRSPRLYDPYRQAANLRARRERILDRMLDNGSIGPDQRRRALAEPLEIRPPLKRFEAPHFAQWLLAANPAAAADRASSTLATTLDLELQRRVETLVERTVRDLAPRGGRDAATIVLDNATGEILAYVGSADFFAAEAGQVDGVRALRQPGSALKPFTYALAFASGTTPATLLPDIETRFPAGEDDWFVPRNYDNRFHGPVRARDALANSFNVPAVFLAQQLTPARVLETYRTFGLTMLDRPADFYGVAITLGDGEVTLLALADAYAALARGGILLPAIGVRPPLGTARTGVRVVSEPVAWLVADILADRRARLAAFGEGNVLELPFRVAAKTGTSKSYRDNWTVGFTREVTVGVWVGNFSGRPMGSVSGITGAGPLFREVMLAAMENRTAASWNPPAELARVRICALSGEPAGPDCPQVIDEMVPAAFGGDRSREPCRMHRRAAVDVRTGLLAGPGCPPDVVRERVFEAYPPEYLAWAVDAGRPVLPAAFSPLCPGPASGPGAVDGGAVELAYPPDGARFSLDPDIPPELQAIDLTARVAQAAGGTVRFYVDDRLVGEAGAPFRLSWPLAAGTHRVTVRLGDAAASATIEVR